MDEKKQNQSENYQEVWGKFHNAKKGYENLCQQDQTRNAKSDRIAAELYNFVSDQLTGKYKTLNATFDTEIAKKGDAIYHYSQLFYGIQALKLFTKLLTLATEIKKLKPSEDTTGCNDVITSIRQLSDQAPGHKDIVWGSIKIGLAAAIILGAITGIIIAAVLVNPVFLVLIAAVFFFSVMGYLIIDPDLLSNFYKTNFSKELDELANRTQNIIDSPQLGQTQTPSQKSHSFDSIYTPEPSSQETKQPTTQETQETKTNIKKS